MDERSIRRSRWVLLAAYAVALAAACVTAAALGREAPLVSAAVADVIATVVVFAFSVKTNNSSVYDPYWSVAPIPIVLFWAATGHASARGAWIVVIVTAWGLRLTVNQLLRWRGLGHEDFRYVELRKSSGRAYWPLSFVGIHLMPTVWVFLGLVSIYPVFANPGTRIGWLDALASVVTGGAVGLEAAADFQLRRFLATRRDPSAVLETGVWSLCRHPNYLGEILFWWGLWLSGVAASPSFWWTVIGPVAITVLFLAVSVPWMDRRMLAGHPAYAERLRVLPSLIPMPRLRVLANDRGGKKG